MCLRVFVLANESLLADVIVANLTQDTALDVVRLSQHDPSILHQAICEECSVVIIIEEGESNDAILTANDLLLSYGCFRMITISLQNHHLQIYDSYQMPISGLEEVINLAKNFNREKHSEVAE
jgi:hypothetical protein